MENIFLIKRLKKMLMMGGDDSLNGLHHRHTGPAGHE
jgi:hypothetical protein